jgi:hypothetical protein
MTAIFESTIDWTGNPSPETAHFSHTFGPENAFMSFYDTSMDITASFELVQNLDEASFQSHIVKGPGLVTLLTSDALDIIVDFYFNEAPPELSDPAWIQVSEGVIGLGSGRMDIDGGAVVEVGVRLDPGNYAFRVYFAKPVGRGEEDEGGEEDSQHLAVYFHKTEAEESDEIRVLKEGAW